MIDEDNDKGISHKSRRFAAVSLILLVTGSAILMLPAVISYESHQVMTILTQIIIKKKISKLTIFSVKYEISKI